MGSSVSAHIGKLLLYTEKEDLRPTRITLNDIYLFYQGILLIIIILNSFLFITVRERIYTWYIAYILAFSAFISVLSGSYLILGVPAWSDALHTVGTIVVMFMVLFSGAFLELKKRLPKMQQIFNAFALVFALFAVLIALKVPYASLVFKIQAQLIDEQEKTEHYLKQEIQKRTRELIKTN